MNNPFRRLQGVKAAGNILVWSWAYFSLRDQTFFAKRLAFLITAGVPIVECLELIRLQTKSVAKARIYDAIIADVSSGQFLATGLTKHRRHFGDFAINLIRVGEHSGILAQNLGYLADELEKRHELRRKIVGALVYPASITVATLGITGFLAAYIFPKLMPIFTGLGVDLPLSTRVFIAISAYLRQWGIVTVLLLAVLAVLFLVLRQRIARLRLMSDRAFLSIPIVGPVARAYNLAQICRTLGLLLQSGVTFTDAVAIVSETANNRAYALACHEAAQALLAGEPFSRPLARRPDLFPDLLAHMIAIGEKTGNLPTTLLYMSRMYETEVDDRTKNLSSSIEPVLMIIMGALVGGIAISVITPIYEITQHLQPK